MAKIANSVVLLLELSSKHLVVGFCGLTNIMQHVRANHSYWKQREVVESPSSNPQPPEDTSWDAIISVCCPRICFIQGAALEILRTL